MKLTMLGTGNALVTELYNTCYVLEEDGKYLMVDAGGGNGVLHQLKQAGLRWQDMRHIFVTHKHVDHIMGVVWMMRMITQSMNKGKYQGEAWIYGHEEVIRILRTMAESLLQPSQNRLIGSRLHLQTVEDGESAEIEGWKMTFFDIGSTKARQFGYTLELPGGGKLVCMGDEPCNEGVEHYARNCRWLLHEAFCLFSDAEKYNPYEKHHSTVKDAAQLAERLGVENLLLYHTEEDTGIRRKELYSAEGRAYYHGHLVVPEDLEVVQL